MTSVPTPTDSSESAPNAGVSNFLTAPEAATVLRVRSVDVARLCREGKLRATKPGKTWLILPADLQAYIATGYNDTEKSA